jgi:D-glycero-alpha-D-manno-heptose-7-phosphate kinase
MGAIPENKRRCQKGPVKDSIMIITQTPLRISFVGGGTDIANFYQLNEGAVISSAIDKYVYVIIKERFDDQIRVGYTRTEIASHVDELNHELVRESLRKTGIDKGVEIVTISDIPAEGTGLGSSSSVTVGLLNACYQYRADPKEPLKLAQDACEIEIDVLRKPIGKQDQYIAALGGLRKIVFHSDERVTSNLVNILAEKYLLLSRNLLLFYTGITRSADAILKEQARNIAKNTEILRQMRTMVDELESELIRGNVDALGEVLHQGWRYKKQLANTISDSTIDRIYEKARRAGALGGKITGAGGGGFLLLYVPLPKQDQVRKALSSLREVPFQLEKYGTKGIFNIEKAI